ncbi:hypothetical protein ACTI_31080 [Actinoplanes sp. OR16]|nr:hypothetical protein ACTI_31080 [Actinoplanes sp. OR16]
MPDSGTSRTGLPRMLLIVRGTVRRALPGGPGSRFTVAGLLRRLGPDRIEVHDRFTLRWLGAGPVERRRAERPVGGAS